jgi:hypothetical protein
VTTLVDGTDVFGLPTRFRGIAVGRTSPVWAPMTFAAVSAVAFLIIHPAVGDLWAARARASAVWHGVGLTYWFSWFGGGSTPGNYSVLTPYLSALLGVGLVGAIATVSITPLCWILVRDTSHPLAATWVATVTAGSNLWSGRIPFAIGSAVSVAAIIAVRNQRRAAAALGAVLAVLLSPVSGAFIALGLTGTLFASRSHRAISATTIAATAFTLGGIGVYFGTPGPEGYSAKQGAATAFVLLAFLVARPPKYLTVVIAVCLAACPVLIAIPNAMGSNFQRLVWISLPVAVVATATIRLSVALVACLLAVYSGALGAVNDVGLARLPMSSPAYYAPLVKELDSLPGMDNYRLEVVDDGTHTAAFALLDHVNLARGFETQTDNALNAVLRSRVGLNDVTYRAWLDANAVGYVAVDKTTVSDYPEYSLITTGDLGYLKTVWSDAHWSLMQVFAPIPVVPEPGRMLDADQSAMTIEVPCACVLSIRVRWSRFLIADSPDDVLPAQVRNDGHGWTVLRTAQAGRYVLHG